MMTFLKYAQQGTRKGKIGTYPSNTRVGTVVERVILSK